MRLRQFVYLPLFLKAHLDRPYGRELQHERALTPPGSDLDDLIDDPTDHPGKGCLFPGWRRSSCPALTREQRSFSFGIDALASREVPDLNRHPGVELLVRALGSTRAGDVRARARTVPP